MQTNKRINANDEIIGEVIKINFDRALIRVYSKTENFLDHSFIGVLLKEDIRNEH